MSKTNNNEITPYLEINDILLSLSKDIKDILGNYSQMLCAGRNPYKIKHFNL